MAKTLTQKLKELPEWVQDEISKQEIPDVNREIAKSYGLNLARTSQLVNIIARTLVKEISLGNFKKALKDQFRNLSDSEIDGMALEVAKKRFWPLKDWLSGTESLIKKLGGKPPEKKKVSPPSESEKKTQRRKKKEEPKKAKNIERISFRKALSEYSEIKSQKLTSESLELENFDRPVKPTLENWLQDYKEKMGAGYHDSMQRSQYLFRTKNGKKLDSSERKIISAILEAFDEREEIPVNPGLQKVILSELVAKKEEKSSLNDKKKSGQPKDAAKPEKDKSPLTLKKDQKREDSASSERKPNPKQKSKPDLKGNLVDLSKNKD